MHETRLPKCLRFAGWLGHSHVATRLTDGCELLYAQTCSLTEAHQFLNKLPEQDRGSVYARTKTGWKRLATLRKHAE